jgi:tyrosinase
MRVRKDWNDLREDERTLYLQAVNALKSSGIYDHFVTTHALPSNKDYAHGTSGFLPWHRKCTLPVIATFGCTLDSPARTQANQGSSQSTRACARYLLEYENALRAQGDQYTCVTVPYWDWAEETLKCEADAGCIAFDSKSLILTAIGGPGDKDCMTESAGVVPTSSAATAKQCAGKQTWGSTGAGAKTVPRHIIGGVVPT